MIERMSRTLYMTPLSPFARKVRVLLLEKHQRFEEEPVSFEAPSPSFKARSPLGKVPLLVDGDVVIFDSTVIAEYIEDRYPDPPMLGSGYSERLLHRELEELADTVADQAVSLYRKRGEPAWAEQQMGLALRALDELAQDAATASLDFGLGQTAVVCALDYAALRLGPDALSGVPKLLQWAGTISLRESLQATKPAV